MLRHEKSHKQIKFTCGDCNQIFSRRDDLINHVQKKHSMYFIQFYLNRKFDVRKFNNIEMLIFTYNSYLI